MNRPSPIHRLLGVLALAAALLPSPARAIIEDAKSLGLELATPQVAKGFKVREDFWKGEVTNPEPKQIKAQMFKGNEYWFWLGCDADKCEMTLKVLDQMGREVGAETAQTPHAIGVRVMPPKTGSYQIVFTIKVPGKEACSWAMTYGYR